MFISKPPANLNDQEKEKHPSWRRYTGRYRRKLRIVRDLWLISGCIMLTAPLAIPVLALSTTFIAFMILDETA